MTIEITSPAEAFARHIDAVLKADAPVQAAFSGRYFDTKPPIGAAYPLLEYYYLFIKDETADPSEGVRILAYAEYVLKVVTKHDAAQGDSSWAETRRLYALIDKAMGQHPGAVYQVADGSSIQVEQAHRLAFIPQYSDQKGGTEFRHLPGVWYFQCYRGTP